MTELRLPSLVTRIFGETFLAYVWTVVGLVSGAAFAHYGNYGYGALLAGAGLCLAFLTTRPVTVVVGTDGLLVRWLGLPVFVRYDEMLALEPHEARALTRMGYAQRKSSGVLIRRRQARDLYLVCDDATSRDVRAAVLTRLEDLRRRPRADVPELRRGHRSLGSWITEVRGILAREGYRAQPPLPDALWKVLEDPRCAVDARAGAAIALRAHLGDEARPRLRIAVDGCAEPRLRVALEAIERDETGAVETLLAQLTKRAAAAP